MQKENLLDLESYKNGLVLVKENEAATHLLASTGVVQMGHRRTELGFQETARLTDFGEKLVRHREIKQDRVLRVLHGLFHGI